MAAAGPSVELAVGVDGPVEWLQTVSCCVSMYLHPSYAENVESGAREVLNSQLIRYDDSYGGVLLAYLRMRILNTGHKILPLFPYFSVKLRADMLIFAPKAGMIIEGKVNRVLKDHIELLVLGFFNAVVGASDMREDLFYDEEAECWMSATDRRHRIMNGSRLSFLVKSVQEVEQFIDITGSLSPPNTGALDWLSAPADVQEVEGRKEKRKKKRKLEVTEPVEAHKRVKQEEDTSEVQIPATAEDKPAAESSGARKPKLEDGAAAVADRKTEAVANVGDESKHKKKKKKDRTKTETQTAVKQETFQESEQQQQQENGKQEGSGVDREQHEKAAALKSGRKQKKDKQQRKDKKEAPR